MAIRNNSNPRALELSPELQEILMRNGLRATVAATGEGFQLIVQGHDSPLLYYPITEKQLRTITDWGTVTANRKAYNTLASVIAEDFELPRDFVHARNAGGRVVMGLHGNRIGVGEYGRVGDYRTYRHPYGPGFLGWTPRQQPGWHMRRIGGDIYYPGGAPMVAVRPDGRQKPGELQTAGYGFYYKGTPTGAQSGTVPGEDVLSQMTAVITPMSQAPRSTKGTPYSQEITSDVYFTNERWQKVLASHGIVVDADKKTLTLQSAAEQADFVYDLTEEQVAKLTANTLPEASVAERLKIVNTVIGDDFKDGVTMSMLESDKLLAISLKDDVRQDLAATQKSVANPMSAGIYPGHGPMIADEPQDIPETDVPLFVQHEGHPSIGASIDGHELYGLHGKKAWYREGRHGREVDVGEIAVRPAADGKYTMTAVINGETITHDITQKDYDKFLAINDFQRMKLFSKIFSEVDMKNIRDTPVEAKIGAGILAALTIGGAVYGATHHPRPEFYGSGPAPRPYFKPGVDTPEDVAARNFDAIVNQPGPDGPHRSL